LRILFSIADLFR